MYIIRVSYTDGAPATEFHRDSHGDALHLRGDLETVLDRGGWGDVGSIEISRVIRCGLMPVPDHIVAYIRAVKSLPSSNAVAGIKFLRSHFSSGLKEAKDCYDSI